MNCPFCDVTLVKPNYNSVHWCKKILDNSIVTLYPSTKNNSWFMSIIDNTHLEIKNIELIEIKNDCKTMKFCFADFSISVMPFSDFTSKNISFKDYMKEILLFK